MKIIRKVICLFLAFLMFSSTCLQVAAVEENWYTGGDWGIIQPQSPVYVPDGNNWSEVEYVQAGFFEHVYTDWGHYYNRVDRAEVALPADHLRIRYIADMSRPIDSDKEEWDYVDTQYGTAEEIQTLPGQFKVTYLHLYCEGDPNEGGQPTWLGECIPLGMDAEEWKARVLADLLPKFDVWRADILEREHVPEDEQFMYDLNMFMNSKEGGWDWEAFLDAQTDVKFTSDPDLPLMTDRMLTGGHGGDVYSDRYYVTLVRIEYNTMRQVNLGGRADNMYSVNMLTGVSYTSSPYQGEYFVDFTGPNSAPFQENSENDTLEVKVVNFFGAKISNGISYEWIDRTDPDGIVFSRESTFPYAGVSTWRCKLTFDSALQEQYVIGESINVDFIPGEYKPRTITLVPKKTFTIKGKMAESIPGAAMTFTIHEPGGDRVFRPAMTDGEFQVESRLYPVDISILAPGYLPYVKRDIFSVFPMDEHGVADLGVIELETDATIHALKVTVVDEDNKTITKGISYRWYKTGNPETTLSAREYYLPYEHGDYSCEMTFSNELCLLYDVSANTLVYSFSDGEEATEKSVYLSKRVYTVSGTVSPVAARVCYIVGEEMNAEAVTVETDENGYYEFSLTKDLVYFTITLDGFIPYTVSDLFRFTRADGDDRINLGEIVLVDAPRAPLVITVVDDHDTRIMEGISYRWRLAGDQKTYGTECIFTPDHDGYWICEMTFSRELYETYSVPSVYTETFPIGDIEPRTFTLTPRKTYTITGKVNDPGAEVTVTVPEYTGARDIHPTIDDSGMFYVDVPDYSDTVVKVSASGFKPYTNSNVFINNKPDKNGVSDLGEICLERLLHFEVRVTDENGVPITDGIGYFWYEADYPNISGSSRNYFNPSAKSDFCCRLTFSEEFQEQYKISGEITLPFNMDEDFTRTLKLETRKTYTVSGTVKTSDADVTVIVSEVTGNRELKPTPDENGRFSVTVKDYPVSVSVVKTNYKPYYKENIFDVCSPDETGKVDLGEITLKELEFNVAYPFTLDTSVDPSFRISGHTLTLYVYREGEPLQMFHDVSVQGDYIIIGDEAAAQLKDGDLLGLTIAEYDVEYPLYADTTFYVYNRRESETPGTLALKVEKKGEIKFLRDSTNPEKIGIALFCGADLVADGLIVEPQTDAEALANNIVRYYMPEDEVNDCTVVCWSGAEGEWKKLLDYDRIIDLGYDHYYAVAPIDKEVPCIVDLADVPKKPAVTVEELFGDFAFTFAIDEANVTPDIVPIVFQYSGAGTEEDEKEFIFMKTHPSETLGAGFMPLYGSVYVKDLDTNEEIEAEVIRYQALPALKITTKNTSGRLYFALRSVGGELYFGSYRFTSSDLRRGGLGTLALPQAQSVTLSLPDYTTTKTLAMEATVLLPHIDKTTYTASIYVNDEKVFEREVKKGTYRLPFALPVKGQVDIFKVRLVITDGDGEEFYDSGDKKLTYYPAAVPIPKKIEYTLTNKNITNTSGVAIEQFNGVKRVTSGSVDYETGKRVNPKFTVPDYNVGKDGKMKYDVVYDFELTFSNVSNLKEDSVKLLVDCDTAGIKTVELRQNSKGNFVGTLTLKKNNYTISELPQNISVDFEYDDSVDPSVLQSKSVISDYLTESIAAYKQELERINQIVFYEKLEPIDIAMLEEVLAYGLEDDENSEELTEEVKEIILDFARNYNEASNTQEHYLELLTKTVEDVIKHDFTVTKGKELEPAFGYDPAPDNDDVFVLNPGSMKDEHGDSTLLHWKVDTGTANAYLHDPNYEKDSFEIDGETVTFLRRKTFAGGDNVYRPATVIIEENGNVILGYEPSEKDAETVQEGVKFESYDLLDERSGDDIYHIEVPEAYYQIGSTINSVNTWMDQMLKLVNNIVDEILAVNIKSMKETQLTLQNSIDRGTVKERNMRAVLLKLKGNEKIKLSEGAQSFMETFFNKDWKVSDLENELKNVKKAISTARSQLAILKDIKSIQDGTAAGTLSAVTKSAKALKKASEGTVGKILDKLTKPMALVDVVTTPMLAYVDICNEYQTLTNKIKSRENQIAWAMTMYINSGDFKAESECSRAVTAYVDMLERETYEDITMLANTGLVSLVGTLSSVMGAISAFLPKSARKLNKVSDVVSVFAFTMGKLNSFFHSGIEALEIVVGSEAEREQLICDECPYNQDMGYYIDKIGRHIKRRHAYYDCFTVIDHKLVWDPAGYVYEAVASNRIEGATVKAYYEGENGETIFWNAEEYDEVNPLITDKFGEYSWMTPEGNWYVTAEKEGYVSGDSRDDPAAIDGWLPVLPPQINVLIPLVSTSAPTIESSMAAKDQIQITFSKYMDEAYLLSHPSLIKVTENGVSVPVSIAFSDREVNPRQEGIYYGRNLVITKLSGDDFSGDIRVNIGGNVRSYAGIAMGTDYDSGNLSIGQIPGTIEHSYPNRLALMNGDTITLSVRLVDTVEQPISGEIITLNVLDGTILDAPASAITDENGIARFALKALIPGNEDITFKVGKIEKILHVGVSDTADENTAPAKPTANLIDYQTVKKGTMLEIATVTEGARIFYTLNNTCPCTDSPERFEYTEPVELTEDCYFRIAAWTEEGGYSERLNLHLFVVESEDKKAVEAAAAVIVSGSVEIPFSANEILKENAVRDYVDSFLTGDASGVDAEIVSSSGNEYTILLAKGSESKSITIFITFIEKENTELHTSPQTGDNSHMFLWIALLFIGGSVLVGTTLYCRKKKYNAD